MTAQRQIAIVRTALLALFVYGMVVSATHIIGTGLLIGLVGYQANTLWVFIDIPTLIGRVLMGKVFARSTRKVGTALMSVMGSISMTCNVVAGHNLGERLYGAFIVASVVALEIVLTHVKPAPAVKAAVTRAERKANPAPMTPVITPGQKAAATRKRNAEIKALESSLSLPAAPVSGA